MKWRERDVPRGSKEENEWKKEREIARKKKTGS